MATYADRVAETTTTTGTGTYSLSGAETGYRTFVAGAGNGATVTYVCEDGTDWEVGEGTVTEASPDTLSRSTILASSNGNAAVNWGAGTKNIFLTASASRIVFTDKANTVTGNFNVNNAVGAVNLIPGDGTGTGYIEFRATNGNRQGYIGYSTTNTAPGTLPYVATLHSFDGDVSLANKLSVVGFNETVYTISDGGSVDINPANGTIQVWTLGANRTPTASSFAAGQSVTLMVADGTAYTITWSTIGVVWVGGTAPTLATSGYTVIELWKVGSTIYGALVGNVA